MRGVACLLDSVSFRRGLNPGKGPGRPTPAEAPGPATRWGRSRSSSSARPTSTSRWSGPTCSCTRARDLDDTVLDRDIRNLYKTGLFEFVQTKWQRANDRDVQPGHRGDPEIPGAGGGLQRQQEGQDEPIGEGGRRPRPNTALDERQVKEDSEKIREYYQKEGYNQVSVTYKIDRDRAPDFGTDDVRDPRGQQGEDLRGPFCRQRAYQDQDPPGADGYQAVVDVFLADRLRAASRTTSSTTTWTSCATTTASDGYLDVEIAEDKVMFEYPKPDRLVLVITVVEGRQYHIGQITFSGNKMHSSALLRRVARQKPGHGVLARRCWTKDIERLERLLRQGRLPLHRRAAGRQPNIATNNIDIEYRVDEGDQYNVESIVDRGQHQDQEHGDPARTGAGSGRCLRHGADEDRQAAPGEHPVLRRRRDQEPADQPAGPRERCAWR